MGLQLSSCMVYQCNLLAFDAKIISLRAVISYTTSPDYDAPHDDDNDDDGDCKRRAIVVVFVSRTMRSMMKVLWRINPDQPIRVAPKEHFIRLPTQHHPVTVQNLQSEPFNVHIIRTWGGSSGRRRRTTDGARRRRNSTSKACAHLSSSLLADMPFKVTYYATRFIRNIAFYVSKCVSVLRCMRLLHAWT